MSDLASVLAGFLVGVGERVGLQNIDVDPAGSVLWQACCWLAEAIEQMLQHVLPGV